MLNPPLDLGKMNGVDIIDNLYEIFHRDFIAQRTHLASLIYVNPQSNRKDDGKEQSFWHLITKNDGQWVYIGNRKTWQPSSDRLIDYGRASRLEWVKQIIDNYTHPSIKLFYYQENPKTIRLYLWAYDEDFVVILQKL